MMLMNILIVILTIGGMEAFSWFIHKYLFHGPLWFIHQSHHKSSKSWFEWNDLFSFLFAAISIWLMWANREDRTPFFWVGLGISIYGILYFILHDGFIHNRFKSLKFHNTYLLGIRRAHKIHHKSLNRDNSEEFGLLLASRKYFRNKETKSESVW